MLCGVSRVLPLLQLHLCTHFPAHLVYLVWVCVGGKKSREMSSSHTYISHTQPRSSPAYICEKDLTARAFPAAHSVKASEDILEWDVVRLGNPFSATRYKKEKKKEDISLHYTRRSRILSICHFPTTLLPLSILKNISIYIFCYFALPLFISG